MDVSNTFRKDFTIALLSFEIRRAQIGLNAVTEIFKFLAQMRSRKGRDPAVRPGLHTTMTDYESAVRLPATPR